MTVLIYTASPNLNVQQLGMELTSSRLKSRASAFGSWTSWREAILHLRGDVVNRCTLVIIH